MTSNFGNGQYGKILFGVGISSAFSGAHAQAQALIKQTYFAHGQAQSNIKQIYFSHGQAQALIANRYEVHAQAQANIENTYTQHAQAQARMLHSQAYGQTQGYIDSGCDDEPNIGTQLFGELLLGTDECEEVPVFNGVHGQAQALIKNTYFAHAQSQADIKQIYFSHAQAQGHLANIYYQHGQSQAEIRQIYNVHAQAQALIPNPSRIGQANAVIDPEFYYFRDSFARVQTAQLPHPNIGVYGSHFDDFIYMNGQNAVLDAALDASYVWLEWAVDQDIQNSETSIEVKSDDWNKNFITLYARHQDSNNRVSLIFTGSWQIINRIGGVGTGSSTVNFVPLADVWYKIRFQVVDTVARFKIWQVGQTEPNWQITFTVSVRADSFYFFADTDSGGTDLFEFRNYFITNAIQRAGGQAQAWIHRYEGYGQAAARMLHQQKYAQSNALIIGELAQGQAEGFKDYRAAIEGSHVTFFAYSGTGAPVGYDQEKNLLGFVLPWTLPDEGFVTVYLNVLTEPTDMWASIRVNGVDTIFDIAAGQTYLLTVYAPAGAIVAPYLLGQGTSSSASFGSDSYFRFNYLHENILPLDDLVGKFAKASKGSDAEYTGTVTYNVDAPLPNYAPHRGITVADNATVITSHTMAYAANDFSFEVWFKTSSTTQLTTGPIINHNSIWYATDHGASTGLGLSVGTNGIALIGHRGSGVDFISLGSFTTSISSASWHHAFVSVDDRVSYVYLDSQLVIIATPYLGFHYRPTRLFNNNYTGSARYAALYDRPFSAQEVFDQFDRGLPKGSAQAQAQVITPTLWRLAQAQADIKAVGYGSGQANALIDRTQQGQAQAYIVGSPRAGQAQAIINQALNSGQAQAQIKEYIFRGYGQAQAEIRPGKGYISGQAQAFIQRIVSSSGNARTVVDSFSNTYYALAQAQGVISFPYVIVDNFSAAITYDITNAEGHMYQDMLGFTIEAADPDPVYSGSFPLDGSWTDNFSGETGWFKFVITEDQYVSIDTWSAYQTGGGPDTVIGIFTGTSGPGSWEVLGGNDEYSGKGNGFQSDVSMFLSAGTYIVLVGWFSGLGTYRHMHVHFNARKAGAGSAQAQGFILAPTKVRGQARAHIKTEARKHAQIRAFIGSFRRGQAQARIKAASIKSAQAQARIREHGRFGQAQAVVNPADVRFAQARAWIEVPWIFAQAQATIEAVNTQSGQAQAYIAPGLKLGQAQAYVKFPTSGQAQALIMDKGKQHGQARAAIEQSSTTFGQSLGTIVREAHYGFGQARGTINQDRTYGFGQARGEIKSPHPARVAQAAALIDGEGYFVEINGWRLPGYAQQEGFDSPLIVRANYTDMLDGSRADIMGLQNKILNLRMRVINENFVETKKTLENAATMLRSAPSWTKLYVQRTDRYYLVLTKKISIEPRAGSERAVDYLVEFEGKPWLYGEQLYTLTGTGTIITTGRTLDDGGWTPVNLKISGTNVTVSGYNAVGAFTGYVSVSGGVSDLLVNSEAYTAILGGQNAEPYMVNKDYRLYVGPGVTNFVVTGATSCEITYYNRWYL